jgi:putative restriction endonuclease
MVIWPAYVVGDRPDALTFEIEVDDPAHARLSHQGVSELDEGRRRYLTSITRRRLHQRSFRERVLAAYGNSCAICRLQHAELLESAHIVPDSEPWGDPVVSNGLALCRLHHAAFDKYIIGIRPDHVIEVRPDVLGEEDGPMLVHGLQEIHETILRVPRDSRLQPDPDRLEWRYQRFRGAA